MNEPVPGQNPLPAELEGKRSDPLDEEMDTSLEPDSPRVIRAAEVQLPDEVLQQALEDAINATANFNHLRQTLLELVDRRNEKYKNSQYLKDKVLKYLTNTRLVERKVMAELRANPQNTEFKTVILNKLNELQPGDSANTILADKLASYVPELTDQVKKEGEKTYRVLKDEGVLGEPIPAEPTEVQLPPAEVAAPAEPADAADSKATEYVAPDYSEAPTHVKREVTFEDMRESVAVNLRRADSVAKAKIILEAFIPIYEDSTEDEIKIAKLANDYFTTIVRFENMTQASKSANLPIQYPSEKIPEFVAGVSENPEKDKEIIDKLTEILQDYSEREWNPAISIEEKKKAVSEVLQKLADVDDIKTCLETLTQQAEKVPAIERTRANLEFLKARVDGEETNFDDLAPAGWQDFIDNLTLKHDEAVLNKIGDPDLKELAMRVYKKYLETQKQKWIAEAKGMQEQIRTKLAPQLKAAAPLYIQQAFGAYPNQELMTEREQEMGPYIDQIIAKLHVDSYRGKDLKLITKYMTTSRFSTTFDPLSTLRPTRMYFEKDEMRNLDTGPTFNQIGRLFGHAKDEPAKWQEFLVRFKAENQL